MSKQMLVSLGILVLTFGSGVAAGLFLGGGTSSSSVDLEKDGSTSSTSGFSPTVEGQERIEGNTLLSNRIRELEKELADQKKPQDSILTDRIAFFKKYRQQIRVQAFGNDLKVTPEMAEILGLSKQEQQVIEQHLAGTKTEMEKLEDANTVLAKQTANSVTYDIPADSQGKAIKAQLNSLVSADIGDARAELFMNAVGDTYSDSFSGFAEQKNEIQITWTQQNGAPLYTIKDSILGSDGNARSWSSFSSATLPPKYQKYLPTNSSP